MVPLKNTASLLSANVAYYRMRAPRINATAFRNWCFFNCCILKNLTNYNPHGSDHTRGTRYYFIRDKGQELRMGKNGEALPDRTKGVRTYLYLNGERVAVNNLYNTNIIFYCNNDDIVTYILLGGDIAK